MAAPAEVTLLYPAALATAVGGSGGLVIAVGERGGVLEISPAGTRTVQVPGSPDLEAVWVSDDRTAWAVGEGGVAVRRPNGAWEFGRCESEHFHDVTGSPTGVFAVGEHGAIARLGPDGRCGEVRHVVDETLERVATSGDLVWVASRRSLFRVEEAGVRLLATHPRADEHPPWLVPDGTSVVVAGGGRWDVMSPGEASQRTDAECWPCAASTYGATSAWSEDGRVWWAVYNDRVVRHPSGSDDTSLEIAMRFAPAWRRVAVVGASIILSGGEPDTIVSRTRGSWSATPADLQPFAFETSAIVSVGSRVVVLGHTPASDDWMEPGAGHRALLALGVSVVSVAPPVVRGDTPAAWEASRTRHGAVLELGTDMALVRAIEFESSELPVGVEERDGRGYVCTSAGRLVPLDGDAAPIALHERVPARLAWSCSRDGTSWYAWADGTIERRDRDGAARVAAEAADVTALGVGRAVCDVSRVRFGGESRVVECDRRACRPIVADPPVDATTTTVFISPLNSGAVALAAGRFWIRQRMGWTEVRTPRPVIDFAPSDGWIALLLQGGVVARLTIDDEP